MIDEYKENQKIPYQILKQSVENNKISHAYLFVSNGYSNVLNFALAFAKYLLCPKKNTSKINCGNCNLCEAIDSGNFPEIKVIEPDGLWIKKEQLIDLQEEFNKKAIIGTRKVYIINHAETLNTISSNSILKFLEEPAPNITAILITNNQYQLLDTIISRCQIINLCGNEIKEENDLEKVAHQIANDIEEYEYYKSPEYQEKLNSAIYFIKEFEKRKKDVLLDTNKLYHNIFKEKNDIIYSFTVFLLLYKDILNKLCDYPCEIFNNYNEEIDAISKFNTKEQIIKKINIIIKTRENIYYNANTSLLIDKFIIEMDVK